MRASSYTSAYLHVQASQGVSCVLLLHRAIGAAMHAATFTGPERTLDRAAPVCARLPVGFSVPGVVGQRCAGSYGSSRVSYSLEQRLLLRVSPMPGHHLIRAGNRWPALRWQRETERAASAAH